MITLIKLEALLMFTLLVISEGAVIALIGLGGTLIIGFFAWINLRTTAKNNKELAIIAGQNSIELAKIAANQERLEASHMEQTKKVEEYHKEVNGKMGILLETTEALGKAKGKAEEKKENKEGK